MAWSAGTNSPLTLSGLQYRHTSNHHNEAEYPNKASCSCFAGEGYCLHFVKIARMPVLEINESSLQQEESGISLFN